MSKGISVPVTQSGLESSINQAVKNVGPINIPANIDPSAFKNLAQPLGRVSGLATEFEKSIAASNARVLAFGASVGIINGVQNAFSDLVKTGIEVQKTLTDIAAISGQGGRELSKFGDALFDIGKTTGQSFKTAAQAALEFSRQGLSVEETLKRTNDALTLTRFTSLNASEAVDVLTAAANSFSSTGITTAQIINKLVAVDTKFAVSAEDLANGLARAGSIAQEVGVNFDELNAAITVAQERTARGGAVIGNALKTIFTRLRSDETVQALRDIGVESLNAQGQLKGAIPILQEVAQKIQGLSGGERVQILEAVASKYNINILSSLLDDLNNANSKFTQAVGVSAGASNQAYERQIELNKALAAQINAASVSVTQLFNKLSQIGVTDSLANLLKFVNDLVNGFNKLIDSEGVGGNIAKGLVKGISDVFFTVGLPIIGAIFIKLTKDIAQFGMESLKTILGINQQVRERQALEQAVVNTLIQDQQIMASILALSGNRSKQEEYLLGVYNRQLAALQQVQNIASSVTPALMAGGLSATTGRIQKRGAGGYLPGQEASDIRRGVGGASPSSRVVSIPNFAFGGGKRGTMIANTSEYIVPNFANGGSAIFNKDMARAYGLPPGARKISAAGGYIPNFAEAAKAYIKEGSVPAGYKPIYTSLGAGFREGTKTSEANLLKQGYRLMTPDELQSYNSQRASRKTASSVGRAAMLIPSGVDNPQAFAEPQDPENAKYGKVIFPIYGLKEGALKSATSQAANIPGYSQILNQSTQDLGMSLTGQLVGASNVDAGIYKQAWKASYGAQSAVEALAGGLFEAGVRYLAHPEGTAAKDNSNTLDFPNLGSATGQRIKKVFGIQEENSADLKGSDSGSIRRKFASQVLRNPGLAMEVAARGYIPNFARGNPLGDAIGREISAGVNPSSIRITQDGRLRNSGNPSGLAVINTRDEPNGKIPNFARERLSPSDIRRAERRAAEEDIRLATMGAGGSMTVDVTPKSDAAPKIEKLGESAQKTTVGMDKMFYAFAGITSAANILQSTFSNTEGIIASTAVGLAKMAEKASAFTLPGTLTRDMTSKYVGAGGLKGLVGGVGAAAPMIGAIVGAGSALIDMAEKSALDRIENTGQKQAGVGIAGRFKTKEDILAGYKVFGKEVAQGGASDKTVALYEELRKKYLEIKKIDDEQTKQREERLRLESELIKQTVLSSKINEINLAFLEGQTKASEDLVKKQADIIKNSGSITQGERDLQEEALKKESAENKIKDIRREGLKDLLAELAKKNALATADEEQLNILIERSKNSGDILSIEKDLEALSLKAVILSKAQIDLAKANTEAKVRSAQSAERERVILEEALKIEKKRNELLSLRNATIDEMMARNDEDAQDNRSLKKLERDVYYRNQILQLENKIAAKPFATRADKAELSVLKALEEERQSQQKNEDEYQQARDQGTKKYKSELLKILSTTKGITEEERTRVKDLISNASTTDEMDSSFISLEKKAGAIDTEVASFNRSLSSAADLSGRMVDQNKRLADIFRIQSEDVKKQMEYRIMMEGMMRDDPFRAGVVSGLNAIAEEVDMFDVKFGSSIPNNFRDGLRDAMSAAISQTDNLGSALQNVAMGFLKTMQNAFLQNAANNITLAIGSKIGFAKGGLVSGGSGYKDDVPAMLTGGEFVMRKSAVQKYGVSNLAKMNSGGMFIPGIRGGGAISGESALSAFANQTTTSGATDILRGGTNSAFINLEDQSSRLSRYGLLGDDPISQEIRAAQQQALSALEQKQQYNAQQAEQRKALKRQLIGTIVSAGLSAGISRLNPIQSRVVAGQAMMTPYVVRNSGGIVRRYASGGPTDDIPALLMSGEYVMNRGATSRYGRRFLDSMNQGRMSRFADGGEVGTSTTTTESNAKMMGDVSININVSGQGSQTESQGNTSQGGIDYKKMSERIKAVVLETINEEKRLGGALRTR